MEILAILLVIVFIIGILFYGFVFPVWMIVDAAIAERSTAAKVVWIIVMILTWTLGAAAYGLFAAKGVLKKVLALIGGLCALGFVGAMAASVTMLGPIIEQAPKEISENLRKAAHPDISEEELKALEESALTL